MKIVFINIVDGNSADYKELTKTLYEVAKNTEYSFVAAPKQVSSIGLLELKGLIKEAENDNTAVHE